MLFTLLFFTFLIGPTTGVSVKDCTHHDSMLYGSTISRVDDVASMADCVTVCQAYDGCKAAVWRTNYDRCFMKKCGYADAATRVYSDAVELCCLTGTCDTCSDPCDSSYPCTLSITVYCTGLPDSWENAETTTSFNVTSGTTLSVTCASGYTNKGDSTVTCVSGTTFTNEPNCVQDCYAFPDSWTNAETTTTFNVTTGTTVAVTCAESYTNIGNSTVTCVTEKEWVDAPSCEKDWFIDVGQLILVCLLLIVVAGLLLVFGSMLAWCLYCCKAGGYVRVFNHENCPE